MTTAAEFRQYAEECMRNARAATTDPVRNQFLELAQLWMQAALSADALEKPASQASKSKMDGSTAPKPEL